MPLGKQHTLIGRTVEGLNIFTAYKYIYNNSTTYNTRDIDTNYWSVYS